nr:hypothetical protein [Salinigranum salinum]
MAHEKEDWKEELYADDSLASTSRKFDSSVTGIPDGSAQDAINDVALEPPSRTVDGDEVLGFNIRVGGGLGEEPSFVEWLRQRVPADEMSGALRNLIEAFAAHCAERVVPPERRNGDVHGGQASVSQPEADASGDDTAVEGQTFREWCDETGTEALVDLCEPEEATYEEPYMGDAKQSWYPFADESETETADVAAGD